LDAVVRFGIREGMMYRVLGQPVVGSKGILDQISVSVVESSGRVASSKTAKSISWYDMTLMDEQSKISDQSAAEVARGSSSSEGAVTAATANLTGSKIDPSGDTSLTKREC
jgi:hypothetical protein